MMNASAAPVGFDAVTVTLNPAVDLTLTVPRFTRDAVNRVIRETRRAGGKGVNVAAMLADLGHTVAATGLLGRENAEIFEQRFALKRIHDGCVRLPGETRIGIKICDPERAETTDLNLPGLAPSPDALARVASWLERHAMRWCVLAGSLPPGVPPSTYAAWVRALRRRGISVAVDTSGEALRAAVEAGPDLIKPNLHELEHLLGRTLAPGPAVIDAARSLVAAGVGEVIVSAGGQGAYFVTADRVLQARPPRIEISSTVGAGDALVAGAVSARLRGLDPAARARFATAAAVYALTHPDAGPPSEGGWEAVERQIELS